MAKNDYIYESRRKQKEARLEIVAELYAKGKSYSMIREEVIARLGLKSYAKDTVARDVKTLLKEWREARLEDTEEAVTLFLERNRKHYEETWTAWEQSKVKVKETKTTLPPVYSKEGVEATEPDPDKQAGDLTVTATEVTDPGEWRFMELLTKIEDQRAKILGLYAPEKKEISGSDGEPLFPTFADLDLSKLSETEKAELLELARKAGA